MNNITILTFQKKNEFESEDVEIQRKIKGQKSAVASKCVLPSMEWKGERKKKHFLNFIKQNSLGK